MLEASGGGPLRGVVPAALTHFDREGRVDGPATAEHLDFLVRAGVHGVFSLGTTGEFFLMDEDERKRVADLAVEAVGGRVPLCVHVGANSTKATIALARHAKSAGASCVAATTPYFFGLSQERLADYYRAVAAELDESCPLYLYNIPGCAGNDMSESTVAELSGVPNVAGIKSSAPDFLRSLELARTLRPGFDVLVGHDTAFLPALSCGVRGCVSGNANAVPELFVALYGAFVSGDLEAARNADRAIAAAAMVLRNGRNFSYLRAALARRGFRASWSRDPLPNLGAAELEAVRPELDALISAIGASVEMEARP